MICPKCSTKFLEGVTFCPRCRVDLVNDISKINTIGEINQINEVNKLEDLNESNKVNQVNESNEVIDKNIYVNETLEENNNISLEDNIIMQQKDTSNIGLNNQTNTNDNINKENQTEYQNNSNIKTENIINYQQSSGQISSDDEYYTSTWRKVGDFLIGFVLAIVMQVIPLIGFVASIGIAIYLLNKRKRRFIGIGIFGLYGISIMLVLLLFGACIVLIPFMNY